MKAKILFITLLLSQTFASISQTGYFGVEAGYAMPFLQRTIGSEKMDIAPTDKYLFGASLRLEKKWASIKTGLFYAEKGDKYLHVNSFEIPMLFGVKPFQGQSGVAFYAGPYISWWGRVLVGETDKLVSDKGKNVLQASHPLNKSQDFGLQFGMEAFVKLANEGRLSLGFSSSQGLKEFKYGETRFRFRQMSLSLGYMMPI